MTFLGIYPGFTVAISFARITRVAGLHLLKATGRDVTINHHWVPGRRLKIHSFRHKGYWWHGRNRERTTLNSIADLLHPGQIAFDVGAHVGYFAVYFAHLVGPTGRVIAFEPSDENLRYTVPNLKSLPCVELDSRGISNFTGEASFFVESLTGQNNSLVDDYQVIKDNAARAGIVCQREEIKIAVTTIDSICREKRIAPDFIKMDIEGSELEALQGMQETLANVRPIVLLEITRNHHQCFELFKRAGYRALDESLVPVADATFDAGKAWKGSINYFFVPG